MSSHSDDPDHISTETVREPTIVDEHGDPYEHQANPYKKARSAVNSVFSRIPHGDRLMVVLTAIIASSTVGQMVISCNNNRSTGKQVERIIDAANRMDDAADSFSESSTHISQSMYNAVDHLGAQAKAAREITKNDARQAKESQTDRAEAKAESAANAKQAVESLQETINAYHRQDRAWVGIASAKLLSSQWNNGNLGMVVAFNLFNYGGSAAEHVNFIAVLESDPSIY